MTKLQTMKLGQIAEVLRGTSITRKEVSPGEIPVIAGGQKPSCYHNVSNREGKTITVSASGAYAGYLQFFEVPIFASDCSTIKILDENIVSPKYLFYILQALQTEIYAFQRGSGQPHVYPSQLVNLEIPIPSILEQHKIVRILEDYLLRLDSAESNFNKIQELTQTLRYSLLDSAMQGTLLAGLNPDSWRELSFAEIATVDSNLKNPADFQNYPHIAPNNIETNTGRLLAYRTIAEDEVTSPKNYFKPGQIVYSKIRPYLNKLIIANFEGLCSADMYPISTSENIKWLFYVMLSPGFVLKTSRTQTRTVLPKINVRELSSIKVRVPSPVEQVQIVAEIEIWFDRLEALRHLIETEEKKMKTLRNSLLQAAYTGQLTKEVVNV